MADLEVTVQADHCHGDEASTAKEESRPAVEVTARPAKEPLVGEAGHDEEGLPCYWNDRKKRISQ